MERRVQSLVDVLSSVYHFLQKQGAAMAALSLSKSKRSRADGRLHRGGKSKARQNKRAGGGYSEAGSTASGDGQEAPALVDGDGADEHEQAFVDRKPDPGERVDRPPGGQEDDEKADRERAEAGDADEDLTRSDSPPLKLLADSAIVETLWTGKHSMIRRLVRRLEAVYNEKCIVDVELEESEEEEAVVEAPQGPPENGVSGGVDGALGDRGKESRVASKASDDAKVL